MCVFSLVIFALFDVISYVLIVNLIIVVTFSGVDTVYLRAEQINRIGIGGG